jgi:hypothetical protein
LHKFFIFQPAGLLQLHSPSGRSAVERFRWCCRIFYRPLFALCFTTSTSARGHTAVAKSVGWRPSSALIQNCMPPAALKREINLHLALTLPFIFNVAFVKKRVCGVRELYKLTRDSDLLAACVCLFHLRRYCSLLERDCRTAERNVH